MPASELISGQCHCGNVRFVVEWPATVTLTGRECGCGFCRRHGSAWTSHPEALARVELNRPAQITRYRFGHETAEFYLCAVCGIAPFVTCDVEGTTRAVININTFESHDPLTIPRVATHFDDEAQDERLARRGRNWTPLTFAAAAT